MVLLQLKNSKCNWIAIIFQIEYGKCVLRVSRKRFVAPNNWISFCYKRILSSLLQTKNCLNTKKNIIKCWYSQAVKSQHNSQEFVRPLSDAARSRGGGRNKLRMMDNDRKKTDGNHWKIDTDCKPLKYLAHYIQREKKRKKAKNMQRHYVNRGEWGRENFGRFGFFSIMVLGILNSPSCYRNEAKIGLSN